MGKIKYRVSLPERLGVRGYLGIDRTGNTMAYSKAQAVTHFLNRQNSDLAKIIAHALKDKFGGLEPFAEEIGKLNLSALGLVDLGVEQTKEDLREGKRMNKAERELLREYEIARELGFRDGADLNHSYIQMHYLRKARELLKRQ